MKSGKNTKKILEIDFKRFSISFDKFVGCKEFDEIFKKHFSRKKNKKNSLFYDTIKHSLFESEFANKDVKSSFISLKYSSSIE